MRFFIAVIVLLIGCTLNAQLSDDFSDGNVTDSPAWYGDTAFFKVNSLNELQLNAPEAGFARLLTPVLIPDSVRWHLKFRLAFAPSTANQLRFWLLADSFSVIKNGFFCAIGENGNSDGLQFFQRKNGVDSLIAIGMVAIFGTEPVEGDLQVRSTSDKKWEFVFLDALGSVAGSFDLSLPGVVLPANAWTGLECIFTATRKDKFYFNEISLQPDLPDLIGPSLVSVNSLLPHLIAIEFNENLDSVWSKPSLQWNIDGLPSTGTAYIAGRWVTLSLLEGLLDGQWYSLTISGVYDLSGNTAAVQVAEFYVLIGVSANRNDLVISEIMADPSPSAGLPEVEWMELYNRSSNYVNLSGLRLSDVGNSTIILPSKIVPPNEYITLCASADLPLLQFGNRLLAGIDNFPSLTNTGEQITLLNANNEFIDQVFYTDLWHADPQKRQGGWSLERNDLLLDCLGSSNWKSCLSFPGGTPGLPNSVSSEPPVFKKTTLLDIWVPAADLILLQFSNGIEFNQLLNTTHFQLSDGLQVDNISWTNDKPERLKLELNQPMDHGKVYSISSSPNLLDCLGNPIIPIIDQLVGIPLDVQKGDLLLNEILFNPFSGGSRYIELVNVTPKMLSLNGLFFANLSEGIAISEFPVNRLIAPGAILAFAPDTADLRRRYPNLWVPQLVEMDLPTLGDQSGNATIMHAQASGLLVIDSFSYTSGMHNALLSSTQKEGIALERIRLDMEATEKNNWTSAANYGSPTLPNGHQKPPLSPTVDWIRYFSNRFSPDGDGVEDTWEMVYQMPETGYWLNATIYDLNGRLVRKWVRQELIGTEGILRWDGDTEWDEQASPGIYMIWLEFFNIKGDVIRLRKAIALVQHF